MPVFKITSPDGTVYRVTGPDGSTEAQALKQVRAQHVTQESKHASQEKSLPFGMQTMADIGSGAIRGAGSIGATLLMPFDAAARALGVQNDFIGRTDRREAMDEALSGLGADTNSLAFNGGKLGAEIAGTAGMGGALAKGLTAIPGVANAVPSVVNAVRTSGMTAGSGSWLPNMAARTFGGAVTGGASAGLVNPDDAKMGAGIGAAIPGATKLLGIGGELVGKGARAMAGEVSREVASLAARAKQLGIDVPADRLVKSKPLDAIASGLNYVPFSGRAATEAKMGEQLNRAASRLMGQDTPNINIALRKASGDLGAKFDATLKSTGVALDQQLLSDVAGVYNTAQKELGADALKAITSQVDEIVAKGASGTIDGQAAYNIKRTLDRIGNRNGPEAWHALELKGKLMDALNRSLGPDGAKAFAQTRQQYGNMLALEKLAKNGVEGELSVARLANMKNINNDPLQEIADIAAQFVKPREAQHGAMQRAVVALGAGSVGGLPGVAAVGAGGRAVNSALNSDYVRQMLMGLPQQELLASPALQGLLYRSAPVLAADR